MKERSRFENEIRDLGIPAGHNRLIRSTSGAHLRAAPRPGIDDAEKEFDQPQLAPRLSNGALGDAFADFQDAAGVPDGAIKELTKSVRFRNRLVKPIDATYVSLKKLMEMTGGTQPPIDDNGWATVTINRQRVKRRVLHVVPTLVRTTEFRRALTVDNLGIADTVDIGAPPPLNNKDLLQKEWIIRILCMVAQVSNEAIVKRKLPAAAPYVNSEVLSKRIKARVKEQANIRREIDEVLREIMRGDRMFVNFTGPASVEFSYYPADLLFDGPFILTNLEYYTLFECMEEARRQKKLKAADIETLKTQMEAKPRPADIGGLGKELQSLKPFYRVPSGNNLILSGFENFFLARILMHHRWRLLDPADPAHQPWLTNPDVKGMRQEHAVPVFPPGLKYFADTP